jgi:mannose-1-phosphate guanylyltransferase
MKQIEAVILAGGKGTRLAPLTDTIPKPLVPILGKPMMTYILDHLKAAGITRVAISTCYLGNLIEQTYGDGSSIGMEISYLHEPTLMGTAGWMKLINWDDVADHFLVLNADNLFWIDLPAFLARHKESNGVATIAGISIPSETAVNYELLATNENRTRLNAYVDRTLAEPLRQSSPEVFVSSGWYVMTPEVGSIMFDNGNRTTAIEQPLSMEKDVWPALSKSGREMGFYHGTEPWFDSGTHERLQRVENFLKEKYDQTL